MKAVNGNTSYLETFYLCVENIEMALNDEVKNNALIRYEQQGKGGMFELAEELADEFETINKNRDWDGEFFDELDDFVYKKLYLTP